MRVKFCYRSCKSHLGSSIQVFAIQSYFCIRVFRSVAMAEENDVFRMLATEDRLDGTNYPLWAYMMRHVLVAKGLWNIVQGIERHPITGATIVADGDAEGVEMKFFMFLFVLRILLHLLQSKFVGMAEMLRHMH